MSKVNPEDTIVALSTPPGEGGIAVIRVSGKDAISIASHFFRPSKKTPLEEVPNQSVRHGFLVDEKGNAIDEILLTLFRSPHSYTGEEVVEISSHGGTRLTHRILELLVRAGARHAEPGEFTKRAFFNGKLDLTQVEAVLDLIRARSDASLEAAVRHLQGGLSVKINRLKEDLLEVRAHLEAEIDFPDERLETYSREELVKKLAAVEQEIGSLIASFRRGALLREGVLTVIVGRPNVGKSSLLNALLDRDRALVSEIPGTTRDALEEEIELGGLPVRLVDTAGLALGDRSPLDLMGMERTRRYLAEGDLFLFVLDGSSGWTREDEAIWAALREKNFIPIVNKVDLLQQLDAPHLGKTACAVSCVTEEGLPELEKRIERAIQEMEITPESVTITRLRHKQALERALPSLGATREGLESALSPELVLLDLREGLDRLRELIGEIYSEDVLDIIFQEFCIGK